MRSQLHQEPFFFFLLRSRHNLKITSCFEHGPYSAIGSGLHNALFCTSYPRIFFIVGWTSHATSYLNGGVDNDPEWPPKVEMAAIGGCKRLGCIGWMGQIQCIRV